MLKLQRRRTASLDSVFEDADRHAAKTSDQLGANAFRNTRVLLIGFATGRLRDIRQDLRSIGVSVTVAASNVRQLHDVPNIELGVTHVIVNFDAFDDVIDGVDTLMAFRETAPDLVVVLCSEVVCGDDFGVERARICDATLKLPIGAPRLARGLLSAASNQAT
ncbi:MAG: hypothetical protein IBX58_18365 [Roseovarius sp.]|nr:hypothetical protein [Roseovarius sp.]